MNKQLQNVVLKAENVRKEFVINKNIITGKVIRKVVAVKNLNFELKQCETLGVVGESGSGKSTMGEMAGGLLEPTFGKIYFNSIDVNTMNKLQYNEYRRSVQFIFQDPKGSMDPHYTIKDIIMEPLYTLGITKDKKQAEKAVIEILDNVGLSEEVKNKYPQELSGGQCQRIAIARALVVKPKVIICDEPVSALDVSIQAQILNLLKDLQKEYNISYIFISHDIGVVNYMSDTIMVMKSGNVVEQGDAKRVLIHPKEGYTKNLINSAFVNGL